MFMDFLDDIFDVSDNEIFSCGGCYYRVIELGTKLQVKTINGWIDCAHPEVIAVYKNKEKIHFIEKEGKKNGN